MKLLKGKRLQPDLCLMVPPYLLIGLFHYIQASIGSGGRLKTLGMYLPSGRLIGQGVMRPTWTEERAFARMLA